MNDKDNEDDEDGDDMALVVSHAMEDAAAQFRHEGHGRGPPVRVLCPPRDDRRRRRSPPLPPSPPSSLPLLLTPPQFPPLQPWLIVMFSSPLHSISMMPVVDGVTHDPINVCHRLEQV